MNISLKHRINCEDFKYLAESGKEFIYLLSQEDMSYSDNLISCSRDYTSDICIWYEEMKPHLSQESAIMIYSILLTLDRSGKSET